MNKSWKLVLLIVTVVFLASVIQVECRRTYSSRSSSSGRGNRGKNQPSSGGVFSSWFGGSKTSSSGSGSISKPASTSAQKNWQTASSHAAGQSKPASTSAQKNWQTASSHAVGQSKPTSSWANPYYKSPGSAPLPSAPKETNYGWKPVSAPSAKPASSYPSSNIGSRGYPVQSGVQQGSQSAFGGYKPQPGASATNYQPSQSSFGGYRPSPSGPATHNTGVHPSPHQTGYHAPTNYHPPPQTSHGYQPSQGYSHQPSYHSYPSGGHHPAAPSYQPSYSGYQPHGSYGGALPSYQGNKFYSGSSGHYGYPGSGSWGIDTYGARKSSGTGKLLTGLAVGAAGGYLTSSLVNSIANPWKYSGYGYGSRYGYGGGYGGGYGSDYGRPRDESAFERGYERGIQARLNENNKETAAPPAPEDPTSKWVQCVAFDPQTQKTLINPNCSCTVTTSIDERTGQPISVHQCTTLNGLVMQPVPVQPGPIMNLPPPVQSGPGMNIPQAVPQSPIDGPTFENRGPQPEGGPGSGGTDPFYGGVYQGNFQYGGGATVYLPPLKDTKNEQLVTETKSTPVDRGTTLVKTEQTSTESKSMLGTAATESETATGTVTEQEGTTSEKVTKMESEVGGSNSEAPLALEERAGGLQDERKRTAEFYGQLQKIVNMGNFVDGG